ncbi:N-succinylglutamate 5-semialdehyde dehydrogenase [Paraburkholderia ultramafica]|uniref:N-succinylglutamate 5-semialdehyde dehydrogenase n=1 Tax=Paraburkholderia ultramafica TaxID=1544867 RepID=A0A6S7CXT3_9BURK|nr:N-succinylglutamate 5-semialdehyde dehydrogenase [Paraburkholderia ultramafica]
MLAQVGEDAVLPAGVLHVVPDGPATGNALVLQPKVGMISFRGSTVVGPSMGQICEQMLKKVSLELGCNNAIVVLDDGYVDAARGVPLCIKDKFVCRQAGTSCVARWPMSMH